MIPAKYTISLRESNKFFGKFCTNTAIGKKKISGQAKYSNPEIFHNIIDCVFYGNNGLHAGSEPSAGVRICRSLYPVRSIE